VVLVEDTAELRLPGANGVGLIAVKGELGEAKVPPTNCCRRRCACGPTGSCWANCAAAETISFLRAINTGHPGSFSTVHANSPRGALEQIALMAMQTGIGLSRAETMEYAASVIDIVVQLDRIDGKRGIAAIAESSALLG
jgi:type IV secretion system protein VirB11